MSNTFGPQWLPNYAIQPLQCQNQRKATYHAKNPRSDIKISGVLQEFSRLTKFQEFLRVSRSVGTLFTSGVSGTQKVGVTLEQQFSGNETRNVCDEQLLCLADD